MELCRVKSNGPGTEPRGTPHEVGSATEEQLAFFTLWYLLVKFDENQARDVPEMPYHIDKRLMSMIKSIVSKAADK